MIIQVPAVLTGPCVIVAHSGNSDLGRLIPDVACCWGPKDHINRRILEGLEPEFRIFVFLTTSVSF